MSSQPDSPASGTLEGNAASSTYSSLDPRVTRLGLSFDQAEPYDEQDQAQLPTYQSFWLPKPDKPWEHTGIVHAHDREAAFLYAKEQYSRRGGQCYGIRVVATEAVVSSPVVEGQINAFDHVDNVLTELSTRLPLDAGVYVLRKRGKQSVFAGRLSAVSPDELRAQLEQCRQPTALQVWVIDDRDTMTLETAPGEGNLWATLPDKGYRDAAFYKSADKINAFKASRKGN